jgi:hypothetical protein
MAASFVKQMGNIEFIILSVGAVVFFTLLLVTGNTMAIAVRERTSELAVLKAVGYSDRFVLGIVLAESLLLALIGGGIGLLGARPSPCAAIPRGDAAHLLYSALEPAVRARARPGRGPRGGGHPRNLRHASARHRRPPADMSAIPIVYNFESVRARWMSALVAVLGIAGHGRRIRGHAGHGPRFQATLTTSGSPENALVRRAGATSEMDSIIPLSQLRPIEDASAVARTGNSPLVTAEVVVVGALPMKSTGTDANVQIRGVSPKALDVRRHVRIMEGRFFAPGLPEMVVGKNAVKSYVGLDMGSKIPIGRPPVGGGGHPRRGGSAFDSELWADADVVNQAYQRPKGLFQSATVRLVSAEALSDFKRTSRATPASPCRPRARSSTTRSRRAC